TVCDRRGEEPMHPTAALYTSGIRLEGLEPRQLLSAGAVVDTTQVINLGYFYSRANASALDASGNVWIAGDADTDLYSQTMLTARFSAALDYQHARNTSSATFTSARALAVQSDGKAIVAGDQAYVDGGPHDLVLARFNSDGTPDTTFGSH